MSAASEHEAGQGGEPGYRWPIPPPGGWTADDLDRNAPQLASLARGAAERVEQFSRDIRGQTVEDLVRTASEFTRRQPALVFGLASLAGFLAFRVLKSGPPDREFRIDSSSPERDRLGDRSREPFGQRAGQFHGT